MYFSKDMTHCYYNLVKQHKPYRHFITLTFTRNLGINKCCEFTNRFIHELNNMIFGRNYKDTSSVRGSGKNKGKIKGLGKGINWVEGYAFIEKHSFDTSKCDIHVHILAKDNARYDRFSLVQIDDVFIKAALKVSDDRDRHVFNPKGIDIRRVWNDDGAITYCFEQIHDDCLDRIKPIDKNGISDSLGY